MSIKKFLISRWFVYLLIGIVLVLFSSVLFPSMINQNVIPQDFGLNLMSECWGLLFILVFFVGIIELRDLIEWRRVEKKVKKRIKNRMKSLFDTFVLTLCSDFASRNCPAEEYPKKVAELKNKIWANPKEFRLCGRGYALIDAPKEFMQCGALFYDSIINFLSTVEIKYMRFLNSVIQESLMNIQDELGNLILEFRGDPQRNRERGAKIEVIMQKIITEMKKLSDNGIDIGP